MKIKTGLLYALIAVTMFAMTGCGSKAAGAFAATPETAFEEVKVEKFGNHIYIEENFCEKRERESEKDEILAALEEADKLMDTDVYVYGVYESYDKSGYNFIADMYVKGVEIIDVKVRCVCEEGTYKWQSFSGGKYVKQDFDIDTSNVIPAEKLYKKVYKLAEEHKEEMIIFGQQDQTIQGEYTLWYSEERGLYYFFIINGNSSVQVDATTGEIFEYYFSNGMVC